MSPSWGYIICWPILAHLGAMLAYLEGNLGPSWGYVGPSWTHLRARLAHLGASYNDPSESPCWPILRPILAHVDPSSPTKSEKLEKMRKNGSSKKHCKTREFLGLFDGPERSAAGGAAPLSYGEESAVRQFLRMFATSCSQRACQAQAAWLWDASATAKHQLISCPKRCNGNAKKSLTPLLKPH